MSRPEIHKDFDTAREAARAKPRTVAYFEGLLPSKIPVSQQIIFVEPGTDVSDSFDLLRRSNSDIQTQDQQGNLTVNSSLQKGTFVVATRPLHYLL